MTTLENTEFSTQNYLDMDLLRFTTAGSVDDGKSTLIGRLLYDSKSIFEDQMESIEKSSENRGYGYVNLALLTDGLRAEREQGITIDVAYRYFATPKRKFIIADTPGHIQYTRNMVTGASTANLAIILVDARHGLVEQTFRHSFIASLLQIKHVVLCINKMDLVDFSEEVFKKIKSDYQEFSKKLSIPDIQFIPISALLGDNVVDRSTNMTWYDGFTLLETLENVQIEKDLDFNHPRFPVQLVIRPMLNEYHDYRGYAGRVDGGVFKPGDEIVVLPSEKKSKIKSIDFFGEELSEAYPPMSVTLTLQDEIDISRGDMIAKAGFQPQVSQELTATICWFTEKKMNIGGKYLLRHTSKEVKCVVKNVLSKMDINTLAQEENVENVSLNDICKVSIKTASPICFDSYHKNRNTGSFILVDEFTNETVAAGMID
ncbi:MAG: GTP-binding protein [Cytophagales bacterium]